MVPLTVRPDYLVLILHARFLSSVPVAWRPDLVVLLPPARPGSSPACPVVLGLPRGPHPCVPPFPRDPLTFAFLTSLRVFISRPQLAACHSCIHFFQCFILCRTGIFTYPSPHSFSVLLFLFPSVLFSFQSLLSLCGSSLDS